MSVAKVIEVISSSQEGFDDAVRQGLARASESVSDITGAWIKDQRVDFSDGEIKEYRVLMKVTFVVRDRSDQSDDQSNQSGQNQSGQNQSGQNQ